jgi:hypothetical protein
VASRPRILLVASKQFGEFSMALDFAAGLGAECDHLLLLPESFFAWNNSFYGCTVRPYRDADTILAQVEDFDPQVIAFFSAYLLVTDGTVKPKWLGRLLGHCEARGVQLLTTDPFLGIAAALRRKDLHDPGVVFNDTLARRFPGLFKGLFCRVLHATDAVLAGTPKLGSAVSEQLGGTFHGFNNGHGMALDGLRSAGEPVPSGAYWLYILSQLDLTLLENRFGSARATAMVASALRCAQAQQKVAVGVFPPTLVDALRGSLSGDVSLVTTCGIERFNHLLLEAERVFYWNMHSHSATFRFFNGRPAHFLGHGHIHAFIPRLHDLMMEHYFGGFEPPLHDPEAGGLDEGELEESWQQQQLTLADKLRAVNAYPRSAALIHDIKP